MNQPTNYSLLQKATFELNQALIEFHQTKPLSLDRDAEKSRVLRGLGAVCALIEHMTDKGEVVPKALQDAIELKHKQLEGAYMLPRPQSSLVLV